MAGDHILSRRGKVEKNIKYRVKELRKSERKWHAESMTSVVSQFIAAYRREFNFYRDAAQKCADQCEALLRDAGIRAIVTSRAKRPASLELKLRERNKTKSYKVLDDIRADLVDLAGVRIAVYFPRDRVRVEELVEANFVKLRSKRFPEPSAVQVPRDQKTSTTPEKYTKVFTGYHATHIVVGLSADHLSEAELQLVEARIEIQIASVLMHAWSEVEHDLVYKPQSGSLSRAEYAALDEVNGLVLSGEIALGRLQEAGEERVREQDRKFDNQYELASFLYQLARQNEGFNEPQVGPVEGLFLFLQQAKLDTPNTLRPYATDIDNSATASPISDQIITNIVRNNPTEYEQWLEQKDDAPHADIPNISTKDRKSFIFLLETLDALLKQRGLNSTSPDLRDYGLSPTIIKVLFEIRKRLNEGGSTPYKIDILSRLTQEAIKKLRISPLRREGPEKA